MKRYQMKSLLYAFLFMTLLLCGCHDSYRELGDSYIYESGRIHKFIDGGKGTVVTLIPDQVLNYEHNKNYIIAYQIPDSAIYREYYIDIYKKITDSTIRSQEKTDSLEALLDSMLNIKHCYWIICKKDAKVYGPMTKAKFKEKCIKMGIGLTLNPKYESQFLPVKKGKNC